MEEIQLHGLFFFDEHTKLSQRALPLNKKVIIPCTHFLVAPLLHPTHRIVSTQWGAESTASPPPAETDLKDGLPVD